MTDDAISRFSKLSASWDGIDVISKTLMSTPVLPQDDIGGNLSTGTPPKQSFDIPGCEERVLKDRSKVISAPEPLQSVDDVTMQSLNTDHMI